MGAVAALWFDAIEQRLWWFVLYADRLPRRACCRRTDLASGRLGESATRQIFQAPACRTPDLCDVLVVCSRALARIVFPSLSLLIGLTEKEGYVSFRMFMVAKLVMIAALLAPQLVHACAVCVTGANDSVADAFNWSVIFLMTAPYLVFGSIAGCLFFIYRRKVTRRNREENGDFPLLIAWDQKENGR